MANEGKWVGPCYHCKCDMWIPQSLYDAAKCSDRITFYCAYGHPQVFAKGETELDKMRRERDRLAQQIAFKDDLLRVANINREIAEKNAKAHKAAATKMKKRASHGVCLECNRTFQNVARHMINKHHKYTAEMVQ